MQYFVFFLCFALGVCVGIITVRCGANNSKARVPERKPQTEGVWSKENTELSVIEMENFMSYNGDEQIDPQEILNHRKAEKHA